MLLNISIGQCLVQGTGQHRASWHEDPAHVFPALFGDTHNSGEAGIEEEAEIMQLRAMCSASQTKKAPEARFISAQSPHL